MKNLKVFSLFFILGLFLAVFIAGEPAMASGVKSAADCFGSSDGCNKYAMVKSERLGILDKESTKYVSIIAMVMVALSILTIMAGSLMLVISNGEPKKIYIGKSLIIAGCIAIPTFMSVWGILRLFGSFAG